MTTHTDDATGLAAVRGALESAYLGHPDWSQDTVEALLNDPAWDYAALRRHTPPAPAEGVDRDALWIEYADLISQDWSEIAGLAVAHGYTGTPPERMERAKQIRAALGYDPDKPPTAGARLAQPPTEKGKA